MELTKSIEYKKDVYLDVVFNYSPPENGGSETPSYPAEIDITSIKYKGICIMVTLDDDQIEEIKEKLQKDIE